MDTRIVVQILDVLTTLVIIFFFMFGWHYIAFYVITCQKEKVYPHSDKKSKFAVIIPARDESQVIGHIIKCLKKQTYPKEFFDVYFIVESFDDPTVEIVKKVGYYSFVRTRLTEDRHTKGYALQEIIEYFKAKNIVYDAYMIFDADNLMDSNFIEYMNDVRQTGVEVAVGYRNYTNPNQNLLTSTSALFFSYMTNVTSRARSILFKKCVVMGTGYYVDAKIIDENGGWSFVGMTEDTELTAYCYKYDIHMAYVKGTSVYDEQASKFKVWRNQHVRWIWGYVNNFEEDISHGVPHNTLTPGLRKVAQAEYKISFIPMIIPIVVFFLVMISYVVLAIIAAIQGQNFYPLIFNALLYFILLVSIFALDALGQLIREYRRIKIGFFYAVFTIFFFWFYFLDLIVSFFDGLIHKSKRTNWKVIPHSGKITSKKARKRMK